MFISDRELMPVLSAALGRGQQVRMTVNGRSMSPFIRDGDVVELAPLPSQLALGSVVLAQLEGGHYPLHRLVARCGTEWLLRGDNCGKPDGIVSRQNLLGMATRVERHGHPVRFGAGRAGRWIAWMSVQGYLWPLFQSLHFFRRAASKILRRFQRLFVFRAWAKRFCPPYAVVEASLHDLITVHTWIGGRDEHLKRWIQQSTQPNVTNYAAKHGEEMLGFVRLFRFLEMDSPQFGYWLYTLEVKPRYRGMGVGAALTRRVIEQAQTEGASTLSLLVFDNNAPALALYHKLGFERVTSSPLDEDFAADMQKFGRQRILMTKRLC